MDKWIALLLILFVVSAFDFLSDPYYHKTAVNFWQWTKREIYELFTYEKE